MSEQGSNYVNRLRALFTAALRLRYAIVAICAVVNAIECSLKTTMSITIVAMVSDRNNSTSRFEWSETEQGFVLGSFFYGTLVTHLFGGQIASYFGTRTTIATALFLSSGLTLLTPLSAYHSIASLFCVRFVTGLMQGCVSPAIFNLLSYWTPTSERSRALAVYSIGGNLGSLISMPVSSYLSEYGFANGWPSVFYVNGIATFLLFLAWIYLIYDSPELHPRCKQNEIIYICEHTDIAKFERSAKVPWLNILTSIPVWAIVLAKFSSSWSFYMLSTKLPSYCASVLNFSIAENGNVNAMVYLSSIVSMLCIGFISDKIESKRLLNRTVSRKLFEVCSQVGTGVSLCLVPFAPSVPLIVCLLVASMAFNGFYAGGTNPIIVDIAPDYSGTIYGLASTVASPAGFIAPLFVGYLLDLQPENPNMWNYTFYTSAAINGIGALVFLCFASADTQKWGLKSDSANENKANTRN